MYQNPINQYAGFKKMRTFWISTTLLACLWLAACTAPTPLATPVPTSIPTPSPIMLTDSLGRTITLLTPGQHIVSLAPSNTEILFAIGAGKQVVGRDAFSDYPAEAKSITDVGGGYGELNMEMIVSLKPDLVLAAPLTTGEQVKAMESLGLTVYVLPNPTDFQGLYTNLQTVAQLTGHPDQAAGLVKDLQQRVASVQQKIATTPNRPLVFYELDSTDPNAPWTAGAGTFIDTLITLAGGKNLGDSLGSDWAQISIEALITQNPNVIILGDYTWGGMTPEKVRARAGWETLAAVKNGQVYTFDDNLVSRPGPRMVDGLEVMARLLHPDLFNQ
jgi:iron complex transport system substrate-binding protein